MSCADDPLTLLQTFNDLDHIGQVTRVMARRYTDAVGPWRAYLSILGKD